MTLDNFSQLIAFVLGVGSLMIYDNGGNVSFLIGGIVAIASALIKFLTEETY